MVGGDCWCSNNGKTEALLENELSSYTNGIVVKGEMIAKWGGLCCNRGKISDEYFKYFSDISVFKENKVTFLKKFFLNLILFIFGCVGSSLLLTGFL